eukprot:3645268-Rhodomonas_salina.1
MLSCGDRLKGADLELGGLDEGGELQRLHVHGVDASPRTVSQAPRAVSTHAISQSKTRFHRASTRTNVTTKRSQDRSAAASQFGEGGTHLAASRERIILRSFSCLKPKFLPASESHTHLWRR